MGYYSNVNHDLLRFIPPDARTVLEIGCGEGALADAYRRVNPGVHWIGVDREAACVEIAKNRITDFVTIDIEVEGFEIGDHITFKTLALDCLIFGDVLEHMVDPWRILKKLMHCLKPGAQVLACIPNVQHWTVIRDLLDGKWDYQDSGLLDRTHLRFFTLKSIREMFDAAGLQVFEIVGRDLFNEGIESFCDNRFRCCNDFTPPKEWRAYQYVVRAIKPERWSDRYKDMEVAVTNPPYAAISPIDSKINRIDKLHIHAVTAEQCCARPRILEPFAMLGTIPGVKCTASDFHKSTRLDNPIPDIYIEQRFRGNPVTWNSAYIPSNAILVAEVDDLPEAIGMDPMALKAVHAIQCSTEALAEVCRQYNPNVMVFPNQIAELPPFIADDSSEGTPNAGIFFGAQNRQNDWAPIMPAINRIANDPSFVAWFDVVHDREFFDALETDAKRFHPFCEYAKYREILRSCDIALLPLEDTPFNRCKSDLKFLECAAEGVVPLMSLTACEAIEDGSCNIGMFWNLVNSFEHCLRQLIENIEGRRLLAEKYYAYVRDNRLLGQHFRKQYEWYQSLLSSKQALTDSLLERCPELDLQLSHSQR